MQNFTEAGGDGVGGEGRVKVRGLLGGGNLRRSDFDHSNLFQS